MSGVELRELPVGTVTFLFTDLAGSTRLWEEHPDAMQGALARHDEILRGAIESRGGRVVKMTGDGVHAAFATADDAVAASIEGQRLLSIEPWVATGELRVRMGLHTGSAEQRDGDYFGPALNRAARLMSVSSPGQVLCSQATADLVRDGLPPDVALVDLGSHLLRDLARAEVVFQVTHLDLHSDFPPIASLRARRGNLPRQVTSFIGREDDVARIDAELAQTPVVTLTGVGGVGKTRLALEAAARFAPRCADGTWVVELAGVRDADSVPDAVLDVFGVEHRRGLTVEEMLLEFLHGKELLVVFDNCEHLLRPVAHLVDELVSECPGLWVLATSREGLNVAGERILVVSSLDVPDDVEVTDDAALAAIEDSGAVRLFVERAQAVRAGFAVDVVNAGAIAQVCRRLDGVPLAIELAAARIGMLTPDELARRLDQRFRVLTGSERGAVERHQTLRAAIDWSYDLLDEAERRVFERLSVFAGGFTVAAVEAVVSGPEVEVHEVFDLLAALVARSLVVAESEGTETRYRLLETIRQYAQERLGERGDAARVRDEHANYYASFVESVTVGFAGPDEIEWLTRLVRETDNLRVALSWTAETGNADTALQILNLERGGFVLVSDVGRTIYGAAESVLAIPGIETHPQFPIALLCAALACSYSSDWEAATRFCDDAAAAEHQLTGSESTALWGVRMWIATGEARTDAVLDAAGHMVDIARANGDLPILAISLAQRALSRSLRSEELDIAAREIDESLAVSREVGAPTLIVSVFGLAAFVLVDAQPDRARRLMDEAVRLKERHKIRAPLHAVVGDVAERLGDRRLALEYFTLGMDEMLWFGYSEMVGRMLLRIGLLLVDDEPESAALITGAARKRSVGYTMTQRVIAAWEHAMVELDATLGTPARLDLQARGATMDDREATAIARDAVVRAFDAWSPSGRPQATE